MTQRGVQQIFETNGSTRIDSKQENHTKQAVHVIEIEMKSTIESFVRQLMGKDIEMRWAPDYFPFTHPSWELEIYHNQRWVEILGSGIVEHKLLTNAGHYDKIGWALGMGLERLAMIRYQIPDVRLFWSTDSGFLCQFESAKHSDQITYKPISIHPQISFDISFWLPKQLDYCPNDFYDIVRNIGGDIIEQVKQLDVFTNKDGITSNTYRIVYRSHERMLTKDEINIIHKKIESYVVDNWGVKIR